MTENSCPFRSHLTVPLTAELLHSASVHCDTPSGVLCHQWHAQAEDLRETLCRHREYYGWTLIGAVPDLGAIESVALCDMALGYHLVAGIGSRRGQKYVSSSGDEIANDGEQRLPVVSSNGVVTQRKWLLTAVTRP